MVFQMMTLRVTRQHTNREPCSTIARFFQVVGVITHHCNFLGLQARELGKFLHHLAGWLWHVNAVSPKDHFKQVINLSERI